MLFFSADFLAMRESKRRPFVKHPNVEMGCGAGSDRHENQSTGQDMEGSLLNSLSPTLIDFPCCQTRATRFRFRPNAGRETAAKSLIV